MSVPVLAGGDQVLGLSLLRAGLGVSQGSPVLLGALMPPLSHRHGQGPALVPAERPQGRVPEHSQLCRPWGAQEQRGALSPAPESSGQQGP